MDLFRYNKALEFAANWHNGQKYDTDLTTPFISHPYGVASILKEFGFSEDVVIAGLLHDVVEDTDCSLALVKKEFGSKVAKIVKTVTFDQSLPWTERQKVMNEKMKNASLDAKAVKIADVINQLIVLLEYTTPEKNKTYITDRTPEEKIWKYENSIKVLSHDWKHPIVNEVKRLFKIFKSKAHLLVMTSKPVRK